MSVHQAWTSSSVVALCCVCNRNEKGQDLGGIVYSVYVLSAILLPSSAISWIWIQTRVWHFMQMHYISSCDSIRTLQSTCCCVITPFHCITVDILLLSILDVKCATLLLSCVLPPPFCIIVIVFNFFSFLFSLPLPYDSACPRSSLLEVGRRYAAQWCDKGRRLILLQRVTKNHTNIVIYIYVLYLLHP